MRTHNAYIDNTEIYAEGYKEAAVRGWSLVGDGWERLGGSFGLCRLLQSMAEDAKLAALLITHDADRYRGRMEAFLNIARFVAARNRPVMRAA